ncbi:serine/threonine-protein kinase fray2-like, partial [Sitodiplosis mosellana]|uniref:serine/threonine-protein kinase fray2-like n=1 Tax=Sitodiplosis mosellana TaxID=263140 RepID=UPI00244516CC
MDRRDKLIADLGADDDATIFRLVEKRKDGKRNLDAADRRNRHFHRDRSDVYDRTDRLNEAKAEFAEADLFEKTADKLETMAAIDRRDGSRNLHAAALERGDRKRHHTRISSSGSRRRRVDPLDDQLDGRFGGRFDFDRTRETQTPRVRTRDSGSRPRNQRQRSRSSGRDNRRPSYR